MLKKKKRKSISVSRIEEQFCHKANNFSWKKRRSLSSGYICQESFLNLLGRLSVLPLTLPRTLAGVWHVPRPPWAVVSSLHRFVHMKGSPFVGGSSPQTYALEGK